MDTEGGAPRGGYGTHPCLHTRNEVAGYVLFCVALQSSSNWRWNVELGLTELFTTAMDTPFLLLPFRPGVDQSAAKIFVRSFFKSQYERDGRYSGEHLKRELRLTDPMVRTSNIYADQRNSPII